VERQAVEERHGLRAAADGASTWHIDVSYINISGTFYYLCSILDGCSRYIVNWDLRESMTEADIEIILERAKELHPKRAHGSSPTTGRSSSRRTSRSSFGSRV